MLQPSYQVPKCSTLELRSSSGWSISVYGVCCPWVEVVESGRPSSGSCDAPTPGKPAPWGLFSIGDRAILYSRIMVQIVAQMNHSISVPREGASAGTHLFLPPRAGMAWSLLRQFGARSRMVCAFSLLIAMTKEPCGDCKSNLQCRKQIFKKLSTQTGGEQ